LPRGKFFKEWLGAIFVPRRQLTWATLLPRRKLFL
jgi:hypothetical protein